MKIDYSLTDMGDLMEVYLFGIKPGQFTFYISIYLANVLDKNRIEKINNDEIRTKLLELISSNCEIFVAFLFGLYYNGSCKKNFPFKNSFYENPLFNYLYSPRSVRQLPCRAFHFFRENSVPLYLIFMNAARGKVRESGDGSR